MDHSIKGLEKYFWKDSSFSGIPYSPSIPNKRKNTPTKKPVKWPGTIHKTIHGGNKDGTMLTSKVILFLQQLWTSKRWWVTYWLPKRLVLHSQPQFQVQQSSGSLQLNLLSKSRVYEDPALSTIFLHNNYNYILKSLKSKLIQLVADKEQQTIKECFKGFSDGLEELCNIRKVWAISDTENKDRICQALKSIVKETYGAALHKFSSTSFTKNLEKSVYAWSSKDVEYGVVQAPATTRLELLLAPKLPQASSPASGTISVALRKSSSSRTLK
ncbi:Exocyst complex component 7 [Plecturocebus cupreus]